MTTPVRRDPDGGAPGGPAAPDCAAARLFDALWDTLVDAVGPTAAATLLQRSIKRVAARGAGSDAPVIKRDLFHYTYTVPASWTSDAAEPVAVLRAIVDELVPLLAELTGVVVVKRLADVPELKRCGVIGAAS